MKEKQLKTQCIKLDAPLSDGDSQILTAWDSPQIYDFTKSHFLKKSAQHVKLLPVHRNTC
jgi:hypothetical protein